MRTRTLKELFEQVLIGEKAQDYLLRMLEGDRFYRSFWKRTLQRQIRVLQKPRRTGMGGFRQPRKRLCGATFRIKNGCGGGAYAWAQMQVSALVRCRSSKGQ